MTSKSTTSPVSFSDEESDKNLPKSIRQVWRRKFEELALADIHRSRFGPRRHLLSPFSFSLTYRLDVSPLILHRVGCHPYGGPVDDLYETPTLHEVLEDAKVWITFQEPAVMAQVEEVHIILPSSALFLH